MKNEKCAKLKAYLEIGFRCSENFSSMENFMPVIFQLLISYLIVSESQTLDIDTDVFYGIIRNNVIYTLFQNIMNYYDRYVYQ